MTDNAPIPKNQDTPYDSPWTLKTKIKKVLWDLSWTLFCAWTPKPLNPWRLFVLKCFGCKIEGTPFVHQKAIIEFPWNLTLHHRACLGNKTNVYSLGPVTVGEAATVAQEVYLCTGTHDINDPSFQLIVKPIHIGENAFIGVRALVLPDITIGSDAIVGAGSVVTKSIPDNSIAAGNPAKILRERS